MWPLVDRLEWLSSRHGQRGDEVRHDHDHPAARPLVAGHGLGRHGWVDAAWAMWWVLGGVGLVVRGCVVARRRGELGGRVCTLCLPVWLAGWLAERGLGGSPGWGGFGR
eukprot:COSAG02_NODE_59_length_43585_cov_39.087752_5_plen_109_part_00